MNEREQKFCELYVEYGNGAEAARLAGFPEKSARQRGSELLKDPEVLKQISLLKQKQFKSATDGEVNPETLFEANISKAIQTLSADVSNPDGAKVFIDQYIKWQRKQEEKLGEYVNYSTAELIREIDSSIEDLKGVKERMLAEIRAEEMQEGSDIPSQECTGK